MKNTKKNRADSLLIDVVEYAFVEWLVRRRLYSAFRSNFCGLRKNKKSFRESLREHIRLTYCSSYFGLSSLVTTAFLFPSTPEGFKFWLKQSESWKRFFSEFVEHR